MNLFIGGNFINTFANKVDILQLIRQVTEDDDTIQSEVLDVIEREHGDEYSDLENADDKYATIQDDVLYVDGPTVRLVFSDLFDADYDLVVGRIADAIENQTGSTLRLDSNGFPEQSDEPTAEGGFTTPKAPAEPAPADFSSAEPARPTADLFKDTPEWWNTPAEKAEAPVQIAESLAFDGATPSLQFGGNPIGVQLSDFGVIVYNISDLYFAAYGIAIPTEYLGTLIARRRFDLEDLDDEVVLNGQGIFASAQVLAVLHNDLSQVVEWVPVVSNIIAVYEDNFTSEVEVKIDLFGNLK